MRSILATSLMVLLVAPVLAQTTAIVGGTVAIGDGSQPIEQGTVVFRDDRIVAAGAGIVVPSGAKVIDARGKWVAAGMVAGFSNLGLLDIEEVSNSNDTHALKSSFGAAIDVAPAINPASAVVALERAGGITRAIVSPSSMESIFASPTAMQSIFMGQGAVIDLGIDSPPITRARAFQYVELGENGARAAGGSRPAAYAAFHDSFSEAQDYDRSPRSFDGRGKDSLIKRPDAAALMRVVDGKTPLLVHVERASDILSALALQKDYPHLNLVLVGAAEGWMVAKSIAAAHVPVIAAGLLDLPEAFERLAATESNVGLLEKAGVVVALSTINMTEPEQQRRLNQQAGNLVAIAQMPGMTGLDWGQAFAAITSRPAQALGMDAQIGSLRPGRQADIVIWDGDPLELTSAPVAIFIDGQPQPTTSRQTELVHRYMNPGRGNLPKAYER
jgi:imidazolonepropionase-like amidohydrolase